MTGATTPRPSRSPRSPRPNPPCSQDHPSREHMAFISDEGDSVRTREDAALSTDSQFDASSAADSLVGAQSRFSEHRKRGSGPGCCCGDGGGTCPWFANIVGSRESVYAYDALEVRRVRAYGVAARLSLGVIMVFPTLCMVFLLWLERAGIASMLIFHWIGACLLPLIYAMVFDGASGPRCFLKRQFSAAAMKRGRACRAAKVFFVLNTLALLTTAGLAQICLLQHELFSGIRGNLERFGLDMQPVSAIFFGLYFTFVNSLLEELFWRGFLLEHLGASRPAVWVESCSYAAYHFIVLFCLLPRESLIYAWASPLLTGGLVIIGALLAWIHQRFGILLSWMVHAAGDAALIYFFLAVAYGSFVGEGACQET